MKIPLPFPYCEKCKRKYPESYHHSSNCNGALEIDPKTEIVSCTKCGKTWNVWESKYYCNCGNIFEARSVKKAVNDLLEDCRLCAEEIEIMERAFWRRKSLANESQNRFIEGFLTQLGHDVAKMSAFAITSLIEFIKGLIF